MNKGRGTLRPGKLTNFLGINLQRLRIWEERGCFGQAKIKTGRGNPRSFTRGDFVIGRVIRDVMDVTQSRKLLHFLASIATEISCTIATESVNPDWLMTISWDRERKYWSPSLWVERQYFQPTHPVIVIPLWRIYQEVNRYFEKWK
jgi:hypothetical protein